MKQLTYLNNLKIISIILLFIVANLKGATYYINSSTGNNSNSGTSSGAPFLTIQKGINTASAGDKIVIATGTYNNTVIITKNITFDINNSNITIKSLVLNKASVKATITSSTVAGTLLINDSFELTNGLVIVSGTTPPALKTKAGLKLVGGNKNSYVDGGFWIGSPNNSGMFWPVGSGNDYRPIYITSLSKSGTSEEFYFAKVIAGSPFFSVSLPITTRNISSVFHYYLTTTASTSVASNFVIKFSYDSVTNDDHVYDITNLQLLTSTGSAAWTINSTGGTANRLGTITSSIVTNLNGFYILGNKIGSSSPAYSGGLNTLGSSEPFSSFEIKNYCDGDTLIFISKSKSIGSAISSYTWDFGDGSNPITTYTPVLKHVCIRKYPQVNQYNLTVSLTVANGNYPNTYSSKSYLSHTMYNSPNKIYVTNILTQSADLLPKSVFIVCEGQTTRISDTYTPLSGEYITKKIWTITPVTPTFSRGNNSPYLGYKDSTMIHYKFLNSGSYKIYISRTNSFGCAAKDSIDYFLHPKPKVSFTGTNQCWDANKSIEISNDTKEPIQDKILKWRWDLGDGTKLNGMAIPLSNKIVSHKYTTSGSKLIKLIVITDADCIDSITKSVNLFAKPNSQFTLNQSCGISKTINSSTVNSPEAFKYFIWNWGDGSVPDSSFPNSQHVYSKPGTYKVLLKAETMNNCIDTHSIWHSAYFKGILSTQPQNQNKNYNDKAIFNVSTNNLSSTYQWQTDNGLGFKNLTNAGQYNGVNDDTLTVSSITMSNNNQLFRCIIDYGGCFDTSKTARLTVTTSKTNYLNESELISILPNPVKSDLIITSNSKILGSCYELLDHNGKSILNGIFSSEFTKINLEFLPDGLYFLKTYYGNFKLIKE